VTQLIQIRPYLSKSFYGDPFDGRLQLVLHEHWWQFIKGETSLRNTSFFYPFDKDLGLSDPFVLQGSIHSFFRFLNFDMYESWAISNSVMLLVGNIGLALIAHKAFRSLFLQAIFVLLSGISYTYIAHVYLHPNITGFALIPFVAYFVIIYRNNPRVSISGFIVSFSVLMLTSWYGAFFTSLILILLIVFTKNRIILVVNILSNFKKFSKNLIIPLSICASFVVLFLYIHSPVLSTTTRSSEEMILNSPNFSNILNGSQLGGGFFNMFYQFLGYTENKFFFEYEIGLTLSTILIVILNFVLLYLVTKISYNLQIIRSIFTVNLLILLIFFTIGDRSIFLVFYENISIFSSIRIPIRYLIIFQVINLFVFIKIIDSLNTQLNKYIPKALYLVLVVTLLDQFRVFNSDFKKQDYRGDSNLSKILVTEPECKSFILATEGLEWWDDQLQAMITSAETGIPTVNGYSGGFPKDYPNLNWRSSSDLLKVGQWLEKRDSSQGSCVLRRNLIEKFDTPVFIDSKEGFDLQETNSKVNWRWSLNSKSSLKIINYRNSDQIGQLKFDLKLPICSIGSNISISLNGIPQEIQNLEAGKSKSFTVNFKVDRQSEANLEFNTSQDGCTVENDPRKLYFNLSNINVL
jgi:hypothetical protein